MVVWAGGGPGPDEPPRQQVYVEHLGRDDPHHWLWHGHPGLVIDEHRGPDGTLVGTSVDFVAGPTLEFDGAGRLADLTEAEYRRRGQRLLAGQHPLRDEQVGADPMSAEGWEWPDRPPTTES